MNHSEANPLELLKSGKAPRNVRLATAKGLFPLPLNEQVLLLILLTTDPDSVVAREANASLTNISDEKLLPLVSHSGTHRQILKFFCFDPTRGPELREAVAMNNSTPDAVVADMSIVADANLQEVILLNQTRLLRCPAILDNILENSAATTEIRRRAKENIEEFFTKPGSRAAEAVQPPSPEPVPIAGAEEYPEEPKLAFDELEVEVSRDPQEFGFQGRQEISTFQRISQLNTSDRVKLALLGSREERIILVRDPNKVVATMVLKSPKITEQEVDGISQMRNVSEEILRMIAMRREWSKRYPIIHNLVRNPKTPLATSVNLLPRIATRDLRTLTRNRSIPELLRRSAIKTLNSRGPTK